MAVDAKQLYLETVSHLSTEERLKLAKLILQDIAPSEIEFSDAWSEQDLKDLTSFALSHSENPHDRQKHTPHTRRSNPC